MPNTQTRQSPTPRSISRREFLRVMGMLGAGGILSGCGSVDAQGQVASANPTLPLAPTPTARPRPLVAIAQADRYDRVLIRKQVQDLFDHLGGIQDVVRSGDTVVMKVNLTGGTGFQSTGGKPATEYHILHPEIVRAAGELLRDAGAKDVYIAEAVWDASSFPLWGYAEVAHNLNAGLIDLNHAEPFSEFATAPVGDRWSIYESFHVNRLLLEADAFISIAKMK
jgi:uncharacterized protein (DUF362 family)